LVTVRLSVTVTTKFDNKYQYDLGDGMIIKFSHHNHCHNQ